MQKHRISTNIGKDQRVTVEIKQDYDLLEILSLKFSQQDVYTSLCADYGVVCGRVTANDGFGIPNAKVSIFVPQLTKDTDDPVISALYPYTSISDKNENNYRYNLLPSRKQHGGHVPTGTFPDQTDILTREEYLEVYESYYSYTVKTNESGDFMIWGVPLGQQTINVDIDLSDIGCFSLRPYDFIKKGVGIDQFDRYYNFKSGSDMDGLPQIVNFQKTVEVYPFWGNMDLCQIGITRTDFDLLDKGIKIEPISLILMSTITDDNGDAIKRSGVIRRKSGYKCNLQTTEGRIEAVRYTGKKIYGSDKVTLYPELEYFNPSESIDTDGTAMVVLPMNMEYVYTNEFGEQEITNDINKGIPTTTVARFRFTLDGNNDKTSTAKYLVPQIREYNTDINGGNYNAEYEPELLTTYQFSNVFEDYLKIVTPDNGMGTIDNMSNPYINDKKALMLGTNNDGVPEDVFYKFIFGKVYTVSSFQGSHYETSGFENLLGISRKDAFLGIKEIRPSVEDDCASKANYFPTNFGFKNRVKFGLIISEILLFLQYLFTISFVWIIETLGGTLWSIARTFGSFKILGEYILFDFCTSLIKLAYDLQEAGQTVLPLTIYPTCEECTSDVDTVDPSNNTTFVIEEGCRKYDKFYNENLVYAYIWSNNNSYGTNTVPSNSGNISGPDFIRNSKRISYNYLGTINPYHLLGKPYYPSTPNLKEQLVSPGSGWTIMAAVVGATGTNINIDVSGTQYDVLNVFNTTTRRLPNIVNTEGGEYTYNKKTKSGLTEIRDGVITVVPVIDGPSKNIDVIKEWYKRKRVGVFFCGGVVNYSFIDNWLNGILYFFKFDKRIRWDDEAALDLNQRGSSYPRELVFFNILDKEFYYRATPYNPTSGFIGQKYTGYKEILHPTTFYDVGVRDEFLFEICQDPRVDPTCSVVRDINATSYQDPANIVEYAINYRLDTNNGNFDVGDFFTGTGMGDNVGVFDGDITQLMSINCEAGIEAFDLDSPHYFFYNGEIMDPEDSTLSDFFTDGFGNYGPTPIDLKFDNNGAFIRQCLNFRLGDYSQKVPFYLWNKLGEGFGSFDSNFQDDQQWDKTSIASMKLQRLFSIGSTTMPTTGYTTNYVMADGEEEYLLKPITKTHNGHFFDGNYVDMLERFENITCGNSACGGPISIPPIGNDLAQGFVEGDIWLVVTSGTTKNPLKGDIYVVVNKTWVKEINQYVSGSKETFLFKTLNNYTGSKQVLSTPFLFYFGLRPDKTSLDTLIKYYGPKGAFPSTDFCLDVITPVPTPTMTPTPTITLTPTPTPTPTKSVNIVDPTDPTVYYYYSMGDCNDLKYSGTERTIFGFGAPLVLPVCMSNAQITQWYSTANWAQQTLNIDYNSPCGFGEGYVGSIIARSSTQVGIENSIYNIEGKCLLAIEVLPDYVTSWTVNLDGKTPVGTGEAACRSCDPPFTGFTATGYSGITCDTGENVVVYSILGALTIDRVYGIQMYSGGTVVGNARCMTLKSNLGPQYTFTDPTVDGITGYGISDSGPFILGQPMFQGYADCANCNLSEKKYMITGDRCDTTGSVTIWSSTLPTVVSGDTISVNIGAGVGIKCFLVTQADKFTSVVYNDVGWTILDTGCDCNGNSGGSNVNVTNVNTSISSSYSLTSECQSPQSQYYSETFIEGIEITFRGVNNTLVVPNEAVQYRTNGGVWVPLTVTTSTITLSVTLTYGDRSVCDGGGTYGDTLDIKVGTITVLNYVAGQ